MFYYTYLKNIKSYMIYATLVNWSLLGYFKNICVLSNKKFKENIPKCKNYIGYRSIEFTNKKTIKSYLQYLKIKRYILKDLKKIKHNIYLSY